MKVGNSSSPLYEARIGLSLARNSAKSDSTNRTRKIHSDQKPRRFATKFAQRRRLIGENANRVRLGGGISCPGSGVIVSSGVSGPGAFGGVLASTSHLPTLEIDARIDPGVGEVGDKLHE